MKVNFHNQTNKNTKSYEKAIKKALKKEPSTYSMEVIFVNEEEMKHINKTYRNIDEVTDVLSFNNDDHEEKSIGDIFICIPRALKQAIDYGHSVEREFAFLAVHGYLHLVGYDHETAEDEEIMFNLQEKILQKAKIERK